MRESRGKITTRFEVSNATAEAMTRWRAQSGEPITCEKCAGMLEEIDTNTKTVARNVVEGRIYGEAL